MLKKLLAAIYPLLLVVDDNSSILLLTNFPTLNQTVIRPKWIMIIGQFTVILVRNDTSGTLWGNLLSCGTNVGLDLKVNWLDFCAQRSKVKVTDLRNITQSLWQSTSYDHFTMPLFE